MHMVEPANLETLGRAECLALLATVPMARVVFTDRALPAVRPVQFTLEGDFVWLRPVTGLGPLTESQDAVLALEADWFSTDLSNGWFVVVLGRAAGTAIRIELVQGWRLTSATRIEQAGLDQAE